MNTTTEPAIDHDLESRFQELCVEWKKQSHHLSNTAQMSMLRPYQQIIGMGPAAIPLILRELQREPDHWFWALEMITQQNPVPKEAWGKVLQMAQIWIEWGVGRGFVDP